MEAVDIVKQVESLQTLIDVQTKRLRICQQAAQRLEDKQGNIRDALVTATENLRYMVRDAPVVSLQEYGRARSLLRQGREALQALGPQMAALREEAEYLQSAIPFKKQELKTLRVQTQRGQLITFPESHGGHRRSA